MRSRPGIALLCLAAACTRSESPSVRDGGASDGGDAIIATDAAKAPPAPPPYVPKNAEAFELWRRQNREVADLRDPLRLAVAHVPEPHPTWPKLPGKLAGPFPGAARFTARGFAYRYQSDLVGVPGCAGVHTAEDGDMPLAADGSLCPSVGWPGAPLTEEQSARIVGLIRSLDANDDDKWPTRCAFDPHHAFVFYGENGAPIATLLVCFKCNQWRTYPAQPGLDFTPGARAKNLLSAVCRELGLGACGYDDQTMKRIEDEWQGYSDHEIAHGTQDSDLYLSSVRGPREPFVEAPSGVAPDKTVADAARSEEDKRKLCAWYIRRPAALTPAISLASLRVYGPTTGGTKDAGDPRATTCADGSLAVHREFAECLSQFPSCPAPVWRAEACVRATTDDPCMTKPATVAACESVASCSWGVRRRR